MVQGLDLLVQRGVQAGLQQGSPIEIQGEIKPAARLQQSKQGRQSVGQVQQVQKRMGNQQVAGPRVLWAGGELQDVRSLQVGAYLLPGPL
jgi:hypothetical protein